MFFNCFHNNSFVVPTGIEPALQRNGILSPTCLPISPRNQQKITLPLHLQDNHCENHHIVSESLSLFQQVLDVTCY